MSDNGGRSGLEEDLGKRELDAEEDVEMVTVTKTRNPRTTRRRQPSCTSSCTAICQVIDTDTGALWYRFVSSR